MFSGLTAKAVLVPSETEVACPPTVIGAIEKIEGLSIKDALTPAPCVVGSAPAV